MIGSASPNLAAQLSQERGEIYIVFIWQMLRRERQVGRSIFPAHASERKSFGSAEP